MLALYFVVALMKRNLKNVMSKTSKHYIVKHTNTRNTRNGL